MEKYRIGEYAKYLGVTPDLLKHYEDMGIIQSARSESGYRYYAFQTTLFLIECIRLRNYGLTLREIQEILNRHSMDNAQVAYSGMVGTRAQKTMHIFNTIYDEAMRYAA